MPSGGQSTPSRAKERLRRSSDPGDTTHLPLLSHTLAPTPTPLAPLLPLHASQSLSPPFPHARTAPPPHELATRSAQSNSPIAFAAVSPRPDASAHCNSNLIPAHYAHTYPSTHPPTSHARPFLRITPTWVRGDPMWI